MDNLSPASPAGACIWLTGLSASGKTSIAVALARQVRERGRAIVSLDGDILRAGLCNDLGFSPDDRRENVRRAGHVARLMVDAGLLVSCAFISPYRADRAMVRAMYPAGRFIECWVRCPLAICEARDPKGLYARARAGALPQFTGIDAPYEEPQSAELVVETAPDEVDAEACARTILAELEARSWVPPLA